MKSDKKKKKHGENARKTGRSRHNHIEARVFYVLFAVISVALIFAVSYVAGKIVSGNVPVTPVVAESADAHDKPEGKVIEPVSPGKAPQYVLSDMPTIRYEEFIHPEENLPMPATDNNTDVLLSSDTSLQDRLTARGINTVSDLMPGKKIDKEQQSLNTPTGETPQWLAYAKPFEPDKSKTEKYVVIVIDDIGPDYRRSNEVINMDAPLTLAFLPYANDINAMADKAYGLGHEILIHMPMEPKDLTHNNPGPNALLLNNDSGENLRRLRINLSRVRRAVGINNHMGSAYTENTAAVRMVMGEIKSRGMLFLDSRTSPDSIASYVAAKAGVPNISRDVFLDNSPDYEDVKARLRETASLAKSKGIAVAIGHPRDNTIRGLKEWLPTLAAQGIRVIPLSAAVRKKSAIVIDTAAVSQAPVAQPLPAAAALARTEPQAGNEEISADTLQELKKLDAMPEIIVDYSDKADGE